jgi:hypothetical protein
MSHHHSSWPVTNSQTSPILVDSTRTYLLHDGSLALPTTSRRQARNPPSPELFHEAIEMPLESGPAKRLDSTPRVRKVVDNCKNAKGKGDGRSQRMALRRAPYISYRYHRYRRADGDPLTFPGKRRTSLHNIIREPSTFSEELTAKTSQETAKHRLSPALKQSRPIATGLAESSTESDESKALNGKGLELYIY